MKTTYDNIVKAADLIDRTDHLRYIVEDIKRKAEGNQFFPAKSDITIQEGDNDLTDIIDEQTLVSFVVDTLEETIKANEASLAALGFEIEPTFEETETHVDKEQETAVAASEGNDDVTNGWTASKPDQSHVNRWGS